MKGNRKTSRVDVQVCIIVAIVVALSFACVYAFNYSVTYAEMIDSLKDRCDAISTSVDDTLDTSTFEGIDSSTDMDDPSYLAMQSSLERVKSSTGARYLYTAKRTDDGTFIYVVDGLPFESDDFRAPGDPIEEEIISEMNRALAGEVVYPNDIMDTGWGYVFVAYYPIHVGSEVIGVVGIEFDAQRQFEAFQIVRVGTLVIALAFLLVAIVVARAVFRRISNPWYRDMANTDYLTGLKNRNAFELDMVNRGNASSGEALGIVSIDLDGLKDVNDTFGHAVGDEYIMAAARAIVDTCEKYGPVYRVGGDEFVAICFNMSTEQLERLTGTLQDAASTTMIEGLDSPLSFSVGWAVCKAGESLDETLHRADGRMYEQKRTRHQARQNAEDASASS